MVVAIGVGTKVDGQGQDTSVERRASVAEHREVHVVQLHLVLDHLAFGPSTGGSPRRRTAAARS